MCDPVLDSKRGVAIRVVHWKPKCSFLPFGHVTQKHCKSCMCVSIAIWCCPEPGLILLARAHGAAGGAVGYWQLIGWAGNACKCLYVHVWLEKVSLTQLRLNLVWPRRVDQPMQNTCLERDRERKRNKERERERHRERKTRSYYLAPKSLPHLSLYMYVWYTCIYI